MKTANTYRGWNGCGEKLWAIDEGNDYPRLLWEASPGQPLPALQLADLLSGSGTESDPYLISSGKAFSLIGLFSCDWDKHFKLIADIDMADYPEIAFNIIGGRRHAPSFSGYFNGNGHTISNFTYNAFDEDYIGIFGYVRGGIIENLGLLDANVDAERGSCVGALVPIQA